MLFVDYELEACRHSFNLVINLSLQKFGLFKIKCCTFQSSILSFFLLSPKQQSCRGHPAFVSVEQSSISCFITQLENKTSYHKPTKGSSYQNLESYHSLDLNQDGIFSWKIQSQHHRS